MSIILYQLLVSLIISVATILLCYHFVSRDNVDCSACATPEPDNNKKHLVKNDCCVSKQKSECEINIDDIFSSSDTITKNPKSLNRDYPRGRQCENNKANKKYLHKCDASSKYAKRLIDCLINCGYVIRKSSVQGSVQEGCYFTARSHNALFINKEFFETRIFNLTSVFKVRKSLHKAGLHTTKPSGKCVTTARGPWDKKPLCYYRFNLEKIEKIIEEQLLSNK